MHTERERERERERDRERQINKHSLTHLNVIDNTGLILLFTHTHTHTNAHAHTNNIMSLTTLALSSFSRASRLSRAPTAARSAARTRGVFFTWCC